SSRRRHTRFSRDWSSDVCSSDLGVKRKESFPSFLLNLYREIGFRYLFTNPKDGILVTLSAMAVLIFLFLTITEPSNVNETDVYRSEERRVGKESRSGGTTETKSD